MGRGRVHMPLCIHVIDINIFSQKQRYHNLVIIGIHSRLIIIFNANNQTNKRDTIRLELHLSLIP